MNGQNKTTNTGGNTRTPTPQKPHATTPTTPPPETALRAPHTTHQSAPRMIDLRLLTPATATWATTWWATTHPAPHPLIATCALAAAITATSYSWSHRHTRPPRHALTPPRSLRLAAALILAATACALAVASAAGRAYRDDPARMDSGPIHARVRLERDPAPASSGFSTKHRAHVRILAVRVGEQWLTSGATALVSALGWEDAARGDVYEISGSLDASFAAAAPSVGSIRARTAILAERPGGLDGWRRDTHRAFARACEHLARDARGLVPGMAIGDDRLVPSDLSDAMKATSLTHLTAVSGSHIVIILAALTLILPARVPLRVGATLAVLGTIVVLVGPEASVVRSVCVASVAALGLILGREGQAIAALGAVVIGTLLIDPWASRSYGFALSALAALAVVGPAAAIVRSTKRRIRGDTRIGQVLRRLTEMVCPPWPSSPPRHSSCPCRDPCLCGGSPPTSPPSLRCPWPRSRAWLEPSSRTSAPGSPNSAREWPPGRPGGSHPPHGSSRGCQDRGHRCPGERGPSSLYTRAWDAGGHCGACGGAGSCP